MIYHSIPIRKKISNIYCFPNPSKGIYSAFENFKNKFLNHY